MIKKRVLYNGEMENEAFRFECRSCGQVYNDPPNEQQCPYCSGWLITDTEKEQRLRALPMKSKEQSSRHRQRIGIIIFVIFVLIVSYFTIAIGAPQPDFKALSFWSDFPKLSQIESGAKGIRNGQQQSEQTLWFCIQASERTPDWFMQRYGSIDQCTQKNMGSFLKAEREFKLIAPLAERDETIGYSCMTDAIDENCYADVGFCHWDAVMAQYEQCVMTAEAE